MSQNTNFLNINMVFRNQEKHQNGQTEKKKRTIKIWTKIMNRYFIRKNISKEILPI